MTTAGLKGLWRGNIKRRLLAGGLDVAAAMALAGMMPAARGRGAIFTLHHVRPPSTAALQPSAHLEITPQFLDRAIARLAADGYDFIALSEVPARLASGTTRPFAAFTLDDGYRNNAEHALPVFERHGAPFTIFVTRGFAERTHSLWWEVLARTLEDTAGIEFDFGTGRERIALPSRSAKCEIFGRFAQFIRSRDEAAAIAAIDQLARRHGVEPLAVTAELTMDREELRAIARHPLCSLGAHTLSHRAVSRLDRNEAFAEMVGSADFVEGICGIRPTTIAYPYGTRQAVHERDYQLAREAGFSVAVTTQPGTLCNKAAGRMTGLPRISLNGFYQQTRYVSALASGIPFALMR